jgi:hypothetical protein
VIVFIEKQDHPLSEVRRLAIQKALNAFSLRIIAWKLRLTLFETQSGGDVEQSCLDLHA